MMTEHHTSSLPERVGVVGGGRMGAGIAHAFVVSGAPVVVIESTADAAEAARQRVVGSVEKAAARGVLDGTVADALSCLEVSVEHADLAGCSLVVEAVPEDPELKREVLNRVASVAPSAVLATNTSSLSIDAMADVLERPESFLGLHFFNPVPASELVEIVIGAKTRDDLVTEAQGWVEALGKTAVTVRDVPGFASSRLGVAIALEAMRMVEQGVASAEDIDLAMTLGYKHPMGPLRTTDVVGLDVRLAIAEHLHRELGSRFEPPQILRDHVAAGRVGRKSGHGFYDWS
ncbi:3-hydroxyacyl-CoA dehydrogenase family protein [Aeromicrobium sp. MLTX1]|uniref:3-hydroxyacyl-CoA dehydrogenase family protein n=2 Tax=unclassified Aeromicrobium TaxID=2633570 RepID=UPI00396B1B11